MIETSMRQDLNGGGSDTSPAKGIIDEIGIFNIGLTVDDINDIMNNGLEKIVGTESVSASNKLAALWSNIKIQ